MRPISLLDGKITLYLDEDPTGKIERGRVGDTLHENCPHCGSPTCNFSCDQSQSDDLVEKGDPTESEDEVQSRMQCNAAFDGFTTLVLAQACAGIDVEDAKYQETLQGALDAVGNY